MNDYDFVVLPNGSKIYFRKGLNITVKEALDHLSYVLRDDLDYWRAWEANIAMAFKDEYHREYRNKGVDEIANNAARRFLEQLTRRLKDE